MILKAQHHPIVYPFFKLYSVFLIKRNFQAVRFMNSFEISDKPILLLSNHLSWWDGFWAMYINVYVLKRRFHFMMLEEQLLKYLFFNKTGGFSIRKNSKSAIETIEYAANLLSDSENMVLIFPQGKIQSMHTDEIQFEKGIEHIIHKAKQEVQITFMVCLIDYFSNKKPTLFTYFLNYTNYDKSKESIQVAYNFFYNNCLQEQRLINIE